MASPPIHATWAGTVKGHSQPSPSTPPAARLLHLYRDCVARGKWARLLFETEGGEEVLSFSCGAGAAQPRAATGTSKKQGSKRPANERRRERARRRRQAWEERRRGESCVFSQPGAAAANRSSSCWQEQQPRQVQQPSVGAAAVGRSSNRGKQPSTGAVVGQPGAAAIGRSSSRRQE